MISLNHVREHDNGAQINGRPTISVFTECRVTYCVDHVLCRQTLRIKKQNDKTITDGTIVDWYMTNLFVSMREQAGLLNLGALWVRRGH